MAKTILIVDDDPDYLAQMQMQLEAAGYRVVPADGLAAAKKALENQKPDLALVDLMLEEADGGFALCYHIKKIDQAIPVLLVTAVASETGLDFDAATDEERSWVKADGLLAKPVRFEQLQREIKRLLKE
ncbi:MAG TPA: response regulator [Planctomycetota bacterium]|nr:response regulator [Planctomycetota bacterium]